jgi:hypothetical protein
MSWRETSNRRVRLVATVKAANGAARSRGDEQMRFMVTLIRDEAELGEPTPEGMKEMADRMMEFMGQLEEAGALADPGARLSPSASARTLRYGNEGRPVVTDGPFAESKEQLAGYMVLECPDLDQVMAWVEKMPVTGGAIEVRPIVEPAQG